MIEYSLPTEEEKVAVRKRFSANKERLDEDVKIIMEWLKTQVHLPKDVEGEFLEKTIIRCKNSIERTKKKLESYFTIKYVYRDVFYDTANAVPSEQPAYFFPLPKRGENLERIFVWRFKPMRDEDFSFETLYVVGALLAEIIYLVDYSAGERFIIDVSNFRLPFLAKMNPATLIKLIGDYQAAFPAKIMSIEFVNLSNFINIVMNITKSVLSTKLFSRVKCHSDFDSLHKSIPKNLLPKDYGGDLPQLEELMNHWDQFVEDNRSLLLKSIKEYVASSIPDGKKEESDKYSVQGTFRTLSID